MQEIIRINIFRFLFLILVQTLIISHINLPFNIQIFVYLLCIILLPIETPFWLVIVISFFTGLSIDLSYASLGLHSASCLCMGLCRNIFINNFLKNQAYDTDIKGTPNINTLKKTNFFKYVFTLLISFYICFAFLDVLSFKNFINTIFSALVNTIACFTICISIIYIFQSKKIKPKL